MAVIRIPTKRGARHETATTKSAGSAQHSHLAEAPPKTNGADPLLTTIWLSVLAGAAVSIGVAAAGWVLSVGLVTVEGASAIGAMVFVVVFAILIVTYCAISAGAS